MSRYKEVFLANYKKYFLYIVLLKAVVLIFFFAGVALCHAQIASSSGARVFHIASQPLESALTVFTRTSGIDLLYGTSLDSKLLSHEVDGSMQDLEALSRLLAGTGLTFHVVDAHTVRLEEAPKAQSGVTQLDTLRVQENQKAEGISGSAVFGDVGVEGNRGLNRQSAERPYVTSGSSSFISSEQINRVPVTTIGDIFKNTAGVIAAGNRQSSGLNINIRGLQGMNRVNVLVDGTQQTNSQYIGYHGNTSSVYIDQDFISGVDISKGPSGGQYGAGAMGGVVNMRTIDATDVVADGKKYGVVMRGGLANGSKTPLTETQFPRYGNPSAFNGDAYRGSIALGALLDHYNIVLAVSRRKTGNYFAGSGFGGVTSSYSAVGRNEEAFNTSQDALSTLFKVKTNFGNGHSLELGYTNYYDKHGELNDFFLIYSTLLPMVQGDLAVTRTHTGTVRYSYLPEGNRWVQFHANVWGTHIVTHHSPQAQATGSVDYNKNYPETSVGTEVWNTSEIPTRLLGPLNVKYGVSFAQENANAAVALYSASANNTYPLGDPSGKRYIGSVFSQIHFAPKPWILVDGGLRVDRYHGNGHSYFSYLPNQDHARVNGNLGVTAQPWKGIQFFGTYARGWRPPAIREAYWQFTTLVVPNPDLKPETSDNFEVGANVNRTALLFDKDHGQLKFDFFSNHYGNYIARESKSGGNTIPYTWSNLDHAVYRGLELQGEYGTRSLFVQGTYTKYLYITYCPPNQGCSGTALSTDYGGGYVPPSYAGSGTIGSRFFQEKLTAGFTANYWSARAPISSDSQSYIPPASWPKSIILSSYASYKVLNHFDLGASAENLTNRWYLDPMTIAFLSSPGRIVRLNATIKW